MGPSGIWWLNFTVCGNSAWHAIHQPCPPTPTPPSRPSSHCGGFRNNLSGMQYKLPATNLFSSLYFRFFFFLRGVGERGRWGEGRGGVCISLIQANISDWTKWRKEGTTKIPTAVSPANTGPLIDFVITGSLGTQTSPTWILTCRWNRLNRRFPESGG